MWWIEFHHCYSYVNNKMGKTEELSVNLRQKIFNFHKSGNSYSTISNWLAIFRSLVSFVIKKFKLFGMTENFPRRGIKAKIITENCLKTVWWCLFNSNTILKHITKFLDTTGIYISTRTIQRCLNRNGLNGNRRTHLYKPFYIVTLFNFAKSFLNKENCF